MTILRWTVLGLAALALPLAACGKKGAPKPPSEVEAEAKKEKTE
ncbi:MAG: hypothetical protein ACFB03_23130 [Paracoccaceae bacterium]